MKNFIISLLVLVFLVTLKIWNPYPVQVLELKSLDTLLRSKEITTNEDIVIVDVSDKTLEKLGQWPIDRKEFADMVERLRNYQAGVIVFPILFSEPDRSGHDNEFAKFVGSGGIVLAQVPTNQTQKPDAARRGFAAIGSNPISFTYSWPGAVAPLKQFADNAAGVGVIASTPEVDGVVRRMPMVVSIADQLYPSLPLEIIRTLTDDPSFQIKTGDAGIEAVRIPQFKTVDTDSHGRIWIDPSSRFKHVDFLDVKQEDVEGKLVIVGVSASGVASVIATPHGEKFAHDVQAQALLSVFSGTTPVRYSYAQALELLATIILSTLIILVIPRILVLTTIPILVILVSGLLYLPGYLYSSSLVLWDTSYILFSSVIVYGVIIAQRMISEYLQKLQIKKQFGTYLSPAMVEKLQKNPELLQLGGETRELSIMFTDVRGFTTISEHYGADVQGLTKIMNRYMTAMTQKIIDNNGTLDKYIGDAQMAFWNAPLDEKDHAKKAVKTALEMLDDLARFNNEIASEGVPPFGMGLGINTGSVVVGNMGSSQRFDYTCLGDSVNLASRLEGQSKPYHVKMILGERTAELVEDAYPLVELDCIAVKGKTKGVKIYTIVNGTGVDRMYLKTHRDFIKAYRNQDWDYAMEYIRSLENAFKGELRDYYMMMEERIAELRISKLPKDWDGVYRATSK
jgi:adenylate cyclase